MTAPSSSDGDAAQSEARFFGSCLNSRQTGLNSLRVGQSACQFLVPEEFAMRKFIVASLLALALFVPAAASAEVYVQSPGRTPKVASHDSGTKVLGRQYVRAANAQGFALTGADVTGLAILGILLIGTGYVLVRVRRSNGGAPQTA
jgi:hypothetical protein